MLSAVCKMKRIMIINGPNLNLLGMREPNVYGSETLESINEEIAQKAQDMGVAVDFFQSNSEGEIIGEIHKAVSEYDGAVINAGAYTHYSYAIHDAIKAVKKPFVEVHMSNIHAREEFRNKSVIAPACAGQICGLGKMSYILGLEAVVSLIK